MTQDYQLDAVDLYGMCMLLWLHHSEVPIVLCLVPGEAESKSVSTAILHMG